MPRRAKTTSYIVANPRGIPAGVHVFAQRIDGQVRKFFEGDVYDGPAPEEPLRRGFIAEVK